MVVNQQFLDRLKKTTWVPYLDVRTDEVQQRVSPQPLRLLRLPPHLFSSRRAQNRYLFPGHRVRRLGQPLEVRQTLLTLQRRRSRHALQHTVPVNVQIFITHKVCVSVNLYRVFILTRNSNFSVPTSSICELELCSCSCQ